VYRIVVNVAQDAWKRRLRPDLAATSLTDPATRWENRLADRGPSVQAILERRELLAAVDAALADLSAPERAALVLFHQEERTYDEIAAVLDVPVGTVRTYLHRGRAKLARLVRERMRHDVL
jgi:RNA polymerase sigma-70 factor (ECF subfamily)